MKKNYPLIFLVLLLITTLTTVNASEEGTNEKVGSSTIAAKDPQITYCSTQDNFIVVWTGDNTGKDRIYYNFQSEGSYNTTRALLSSDSSLFAEKPQVAYDSSTSTVGVVYSESNALGKDSIILSFINAASGSKINDHVVGTANTWNMSASIASNNNNTFLVAYYDTSNLKIIAKRFNNSGSLLGTDFISDPIPIAYMLPYSIDIAYNSTDGNFLIVWADLGSNLYSRIITPGGTLGTITSYGSLTGVANPAVAYNDKTNEFFIAYDDFAGNVNGYVTDNIGGITSTAFTFGNASLESAPDVWFNNTNKAFVIAWQEYLGGAGIWIQEYVSGSCQERTDSVKIDDITSTSNAPTIAYGSVSENYWVVWYGNETGKDEIFLQRYSSDIVKPTITCSDADSTICPGVQVTFTTQGGTNYNFKLNGVSVQNGASATYVTSSLSDGDEVKALVTKTGGCLDSTGIIKMTVDPTLDECCSNPTDPGEIASNQNICSGTIPSGLTSITLPTTYLGTLEYKWQQSTTNSTSGFTDIGSSNASTYQPGTPTTTTWFKRLARVDCKPDWSGAGESNVVEITVEPIAVSGTLVKSPDSDNVCEGTDVSTTLTAGAGGNGTDELELRTNNGTTWSAWSSYTSGTIISTIAKTAVEIRTRRMADYCSDAAYNTASWTVEQTPVSGTLAKTPGATNFCEGTNVSATLTAGSGGNGTDELRSRTNDGSTWSAWSAYISGTNISTAGKTAVEIQTRRMADHCSNAAYNTVNWTVEQTPVSGTLAKTPGADSFCAGTDVSATLTAGTGGNGTDELGSRTNNGIIWSAWSAYTSGTIISTAGKTAVEIRTRRVADFCTDAAYNTVSWTIGASGIFISGGVDNNFSTAANWCNGIVPPANSDIVIMDGLTMVIDIDYTCKTLKINAGASFYCNGGVLTVTEAIINKNGVIRVQISSAIEISSSVSVN